MRVAGIIRIIVGLVLAVLLTAILVVLLTGQNMFSRLGWNGGWLNNFVDRVAYTSGGVNTDTNSTVVSDQASVPANQVEKIKIDWVSGNIQLVVGTGSDIVFYESSYRDLTDAQKMRYSVSSNGTLQIRYCQDLDNILNWFSLDQNMPSKDLVMEVPEALIGSLQDIEIDAVSASVDLNGVYGNETEIDTVSGKIYCVSIDVNTLEIDSTSGAIVCENSSAETVSVDNVSGSIQLSGTFDKIDVDTVSGETRIACVVVPSRIEADGVSGRVTILLPENAGFVASLDSISGSISSDFSGTLGDDRIVVGDGSASIRVNTVSGSLLIEKN